VDQPSRAPAVDVAPGAAAPAAAAVERGATLWFWLPWPLLVALDLWSKSAVFGFLDAEAGRRGFQHIAEGRRPPFLVFDTTPLRLDLVSWGNTGTIWGLFQNGTVVLMVVRCAAVVGLFWFVRNTAKAARLQQLVLSLVLAGALGNLYDNFVRADRSVRDFLFFSGRWPFEWTFPAFNVADSCITVGAIGLFLLLWREDGKARRASAA
jgi:lipoprotein signal peptidase